MAERYVEYLPAYSSNVLGDIAESRSLAQPDNPGEDDELIV